MNEREIFIAALQEKDAAVRRTFLENTCGQNAALREQIEGLLLAYENAGSFLESPQSASPDAEGPITERAGSHIGHYKLLEQIGEGGFGVVFMAEQNEPVRRKVALKILKPGMDTRQVVARFEAERQALAIMDHPNIARVFDGGATASGRPYFVMELVRGIPITDFCDQNHLNVRERLALFLDVCEAVQHAHQKGIIHRDIKPTNLLVTLLDDRPVVKAIDFGIAKALGQQLTDKTLFTNFAQMIGTPLYMSPEQAQMSAVDVDTRSDIYSLGVLLYELLTGTTPFDKERLQTAAYDEIRRIIREEEPAKPSTRLSTLGQAAATVSANRNCEATKLSQLCRGELDWIVMKALEKDRSRRYASANGFAMDVRRYLADEQVQACPPSAAYRVRKFVRRHKGPVLAAGLVLLALVAGIVGTSWQAYQATLAKQDSDANELAARTQERLANLNAGRAERQRQEAVSNLYSSLVGEARGLRLARVNGYRARAWQKLQAALKLDTPRRDMEELRQEAVACMGDFTGLEPITLTGFKANVATVAPHPSGTSLAIGLGDGTILIKSLPTGTTVAAQGEHRSGVTALAFSRDGSKLFSADQGGWIKIWEASPAGAWNCNSTIAAGSEIRTLALTPDGSRLAAGCPGTATVGLWDLATEMRVADFRAGEGELLACVAMSPDGDSLAASYYPRSAPSELVGRGLMVWDVRSREVKVRREWATHLTRLGPVRCMAYSADGKGLACGAGGIILLDTADYQDRAIVRQDPIWALSFSPDNRTLALSSQSNVVRLWDVAVNRESAVLDHQAGSVAFSGNGEVLLSASASAVKVWSPTATTEKRVLLGHGSGQVPAMAFTSDGKLLASSGGHDGTIALSDSATGRRIRSLPHGLGYAQSVAFSHDGQLVAAGARGGGLEFWDVASGEKVLDVHHALGGDALAFSPDGGFVAACGNQGVTLWQLKRLSTATANAKPVLELKEAYQARLVTSELPAVYFSPDSKRLVCALNDGTLHVCDVERRRPSLSPPARIRGSLLNGGFFPDSKHLLVLAATPEVWDVTTGERTASFGPGEFAPPQAVLSRDGRRLAVRRRSWAMDVWDVATRKRLLSLPEERMHIWSHALSADGERLAIGLSDGGLSIWNLAQVRAQLEEIGLGWKQESGASQALEMKTDATPAGRHLSGKLHLTHGQLLMGRNRSEEAELSFRQAIGILDKLSRDVPSNAEYRRSQSEAVASLHTMVGVRLFAKGDFDGAAAALDVAERNEAAFPNAERRKIRGAVYKDLAFVRAQKGDWKMAASESEKAVARGADPADLETNGWQLAWLRMYSEDPAEHRGHCMRLLERYEKTTNPWLALQAVRICVICADRAIDPPRAVQLANRATEMSPDNAYFWDTLGLAQYRAGNWKASVAAHAKAAEHRARTGTVTEWPFVLAMAHWKLGDKDDARKSFDMGMQWLEQNKTQLNDHRFRKEIHSFRNEAAVLLEIKVGEDPD